MIYQITFSCEEGENFRRVGERARSDLDTNGFEFRV